MTLHRSSQGPKGDLDRKRGEGKKGGRECCSPLAKCQWIICILTLICVSHQVNYFGSEWSEYEWLLSYYGPILQDKEEQHPKTNHRPLLPQETQWQYPVCTQNPYLHSIDESLDEVGSRAVKWLSEMGTHRQKAADPFLSTKGSRHARFFPFEEMATCHQKDCVGGSCGDDESKISCGLDALKDGCIIYSIGGNNKWAFEVDLLRRTPCKIHTFDCTGRIDRFRKPTSDRLHFHHICLGIENKPMPVKPCQGPRAICGEMWTLLEIQRRLNHTRIDLLKMDIEGFEWPIFESWPEIEKDPKMSEQTLLPMQIMVEVHYHTNIKELLQHYNISTERDYFRFPQHFVDLQAHLLKMGYSVVVRDDNEHCGHCTELTLLRTACPS
eukprot:scaffold6007_cov183-Amphora_coffeaeformis.AAC.32